MANTSSAASGGDPVTQQGRFLSLDTPAGEDVLLIERCSASETLSGLYSLEMDLLLDLQKHRTSEVKPKELLGNKVTLTAALAEGKRYFSGIVKSFAQEHSDDRFQYYRAEIVPWTWLLTLESDCRVFQNLAVPAIVKEIFDDLKGTYPDLVAYRNALNKTYVSWDYCVQYRETDFNFISRLLEHEGIFYFFEHTEHGHTLVLADANTAFAEVPDQDGVFRYAPEGGYGERQDVVHSIGRRFELEHGKWALRDHHFEMPTKSLEKSETTAIPVANNPNLRLYDYPGEYAKLFNAPAERLGGVESTGEAMARLRMQEEEAGYEVLTGNSDARAFYSGSQFELANHRDLAGKYALVSVHHSMSQSPSYVSGESSPTAYQNSFVCIPFAVPFVPRRLTPKPMVQGPQTAVVTVKSGEESWLDKYGRVRIQFHWDRLGQSDEKSTCWVRVAQPWAGNQWGAHFWPRVGQEVVVEFLEGDPDQPLVTGSVYNADQMPPYDLPQFYTRSGVKTRSSKGGAASNYNELRLEDKTGDEQVFLQAEKDMDVRVKNDSREYIGNDRHLIVHVDQHELVEGNKHGHVKGSHFEKIEGDMSLQITGMQNEKVTGSKSMEVVSDHKEKIGGSASLNISGDQKENIGGSVSLQVGQERDEKIGTTHAMEAGQTIHLKGGMTVIIEAGMQLSLKGPGGFVDIGPSGVSIQGTMVLINSGGAAGSGPGASPDSPDAPAPPLDNTDPDTADDGSKGTKL
jgi:type VI secretion system secreted protein VgrG